MPNFFSKDYLSNYKATFLLAYPITISQLGHILVGVVDTAMVGKIGSMEQAAVALSNSFYTIVLVFGLGISYGITPLVAAADSSKNYSLNASLLKHGIIINTLVGIALFVLLYFTAPILYHFNQKKELVDITIPFLNVMMLGMIPLCIFSGFKQFTEGLSYTRVAMFITVSSNILNVVLNYTLIFGRAGFPKMGLMGSCWASFISRTTMAIAMFAYVYFNKSFKVYWKEFSIQKLSADLSKKILGIGIPTGLQWVFEIGAFAFAVIMIGWINPETLAAHQISISLAATTYMMASGISSAASVRVGNQFGLKNNVGVRIAGFSAFILVLLFMGLMAMLFILMHEFLPTLFSNSKIVIDIASSLIIITAFFQLSDGVQVVGLGALRGLKDVKLPTIITIISYWTIGIPLSYFFGFEMELGVQGIWYGLSIGLTSAAVLLFLRFNHVSRRAIS
jgi:MATE family multidrug resistance protein